MKPKLLFLIVLIFFSIYIQFRLKNEIVMTNKNILGIDSELKGEKATNDDLTSTYDELRSYSRIVEIATNELDMIFNHTDPDNVHVIYQDVRSNRTFFTFLDPITTSAEALTR
ncbi:MAG: hypothetical protein K0B81_07410 [Candidatus Cloacimonetes bacterium]|nr:hypothetical protein [Candidatus Cloacimonadota bacterium]